MKGICTENIEATKNLGKLKDAFLKRGHGEKLVKKQFDHVENTERWTIIKKWIDNIIQQTHLFYFLQVITKFSWYSWKKLAYSLYPQLTKRFIPLAFHRNRKLKSIIAGTIIINNK